MYFAHWLLHSAGCKSPSWLYDPLSTDTKYGDLLQYILTADMTCTSDFYTDFPAPSVSRQVFRYIFESPEMPSFSYNLTYYVTNSTYDQIISTNTTYTGGIELIAHYQYAFFPLPGAYASVSWYLAQLLLTTALSPQSVKFSVDVANWNWNGSSAGDPRFQSFFQTGVVIGGACKSQIGAALWFNIARRDLLTYYYPAAMTPDGAILKATNSNTSHTIEVTLPDSVVAIQIDKGFTSDLLTRIGPSVDPDIPYYPLGASDSELPLQVTVAFCLQHWQSLSYDPTMSILFAPPSTNGPTANNAWIPAVAVLVPVVVIVAILSVVIWQCRPKLQGFFLAEAADRG